MALLKQWQKMAYDTTANDQNTLRKLWDDYFLQEKRVYIELLKNPGEDIKGTVRELAEKYQMSIMYMTGFLDGINESLKEANPIEEMEEDTVVNLNYDLEKLYMNMVDAKADWLYNIEAWKTIFDDEKREALYKEARQRGTVRNEGAKIYPNDPCPCGSGKKYKKCCGKAG